MKTADSLPDDLFDAAERHAKRQQKSRSPLYAEALAAYLPCHASDGITEAMDRVVEQLGEPAPEPFLTGAARRALERTEKCPAPPRAEDRARFRPSWTHHWTRLGRLIR